ncbi:MAG: alpha/beta fold hydrolase [Acidobacteriota bacterium]|nr:alpha/beta hydrolase [Blastocatellia bacterium]MDW8241281.1 alpha/beta fold hydrolase [Acidobacteriota bacterium]
MPKIKVNEIELYYEIHGGESHEHSGRLPLLLIAGLGFGAWSWYRQIPALAREFVTIAFDNRGAGQSDKPDTEYTIKMMADDAAMLLRALKVERAHVLGHSMGGYIAQELALGYPDLVASLVLVSSSFGGKNAVLMSAETAAQMRSELEAEDPEVALRKGLSLRFSDRFIAEHPDLVNEFIAVRRAHLPPREAWLRQFVACLTFETESRLPSLRIPTLIVTGDDDPIVPAENSRRLAASIPGSQLRVLEGARHLLFIEHAEAFNHIVIEFLKALN